MFRLHCNFHGKCRPATTTTTSSDQQTFIDHFSYGASYDLAARRKNATRESTATLKAWLNEHKKNPYPTKGEKIMLAIITKMTLTQVSTWFANARRRLKKENKMTWEPKNRTDDDDDALVSDDEKEKDDLESSKDSHGGSLSKGKFDYFSQFPNNYLQKISINLVKGLVRSLSTKQSFRYLSMQMLLRTKKSCWRRIRRTLASQTYCVLALVIPRLAITPAPLAVATRRRTIRTIIIIISTLLITSPSRPCCRLRSMPATVDRAWPGSTVNTAIQKTN